MHQELFLMGVVFLGSNLVTNCRSFKSQGLCLHANDWKAMILAGVTSLVPRPSTPPVFNCLQYAY